MVATHLLHLSNNAASSVDEAVARLVSSDVLNGRYRISMPVVTCTGSMVDVSVWPEPDGGFMVSDDGSAYFEITSGAFSERIFGSVARARCAVYGALFDGGTMLFIRVAADRLRGAIIAMASLIKEVVDETITRSIKAKAERERDLLYDRLDTAFLKSNVERGVEVVGASTAGYTVDAVVKTDHGPIVFDLFTKDPISVAAAFTKLSDIYRLEDGPRLAAVTRDPSAVGPKLQLVSSVASVIRVDAAIETFRRLAA